GLIRRLRLRAPAHITLLTSSRAQRPQGANGGEAGASGRNYLLLPDGTRQELPAFWSGICPADTVLTVETPGGGGWGAPPD
ncbi:MAG TPA: hydantoinase B/oxoprolinase family protein, partial [Chthonomonas sp.]|uniref:hydantoinase B/oxoprolinase family protein n=1 Tax=Chthonomonas sp. TaxID=2282153 RepID=UPI002B4B7765